MPLSKLLARGGDADGTQECTEILFIDFYEGFTVREKRESTCAVKPSSLFASWQTHDHVHDTYHLEIDVAELDAQTNRLRTASKNSATENRS